MISIGSIDDANEYVGGSNNVIEITKMIKIILKFIHKKFLLNYKKSTCI